MAIDFAAIRAARAKAAAEAKASAPSAPVVLSQPASPNKRRGRCKEDDIKNLVDLVTDAEDKMTQWETDFCFSCAKWLDSKELAQLSAKQGATLDELVDKHL